MRSDIPWFQFYGEVPHTIDYPRVTLYEAIVESARRVPEEVAWDFIDTTCTYARFVRAIDQCANALAHLGLKQGDRFLISMPTTPQGIISFYAANKIGAVPAVIHPLSTAAEIENYIELSQARIALTLDLFYPKFAALPFRSQMQSLILARIPDYLSGLKKLGFWVTKGRKIPRVPHDPRVHWWTNLMGGSYTPVQRAAGTTDDPAAILFSGGTTGVPKGILLSNRNFLAESMQASAWVGLAQGDAIMAVLPIFHGFGLGICLNAAFVTGAKSIMTPVFSAESVAKLVCRKRASILVGPPTLFHALAHNRAFARSDLSSLRVTLSGADTLPKQVKKDFDGVLKKCGASGTLLEGYGLTECVSGIMALPIQAPREGSMGIPFPDMLVKICKPGTTEEAAAEEEGEICISGPSVMLGYAGDAGATAETLKEHRDGRLWLHTGDLGRMDADGYFYFTLRLKRMIKSSGYNVYPTQVENVLYGHPMVAEVCVVGVPDQAQVERVKAFVVLKDFSRENPTTEMELIEHCQRELVKWACPREIEFRRRLPRTPVGKVDYKTLMQEQGASDRLQESS